MNNDQFQGIWKQIKGKVKSQWGKLTDDDLTQISGKRDVLVGKLQERYGYAREKAESAISEFETTLGEEHFSSSAPRKGNGKNPNRSV